MGANKSEFTQMRDEEQQQAVAAKVGVTGSSLLPQKTLLGLSKSDLKTAANNVVQGVVEGITDAGDVMIAVKKAQEYLKGIEDNVKPYFYGGNYATKAEPRVVHGAKIEQAELGVSYDYANCHDVQYDRLVATLEEAKEEVKNREIFLKTINKSTEILDPETGEVYTAYPAVKKSTTGYKISIQ